MQSFINSKAVKSVVRTDKGRQDVVVGRTNALRTILSSLCESYHASHRPHAGAFLAALAAACKRACPAAWPMPCAAPALSLAGARRLQGQRLARRVTAPDIG